MFMSQLNGSHLVLAIDVVGGRMPGFDDRPVEGPGAGSAGIRGRHDGGPSVPRNAGSRPGAVSLRLKYGRSSS
jgi:hypothetical protein